VSYLVFFPCNLSTQYNAQIKTNNQLSILQYDTHFFIRILFIIRGEGGEEFQIGRGLDSRIPVPSEVSLRIAGTRLVQFHLVKRRASPSQN